MENGEKIIKKNRKLIKENNKDLEKLNVKIADQKKEINKLKQVQIEAYEKLRDTVEK